MEVSGFGRIYPTGVRGMKVSVIVPNNGRNIEKLVDSIKNSTYRNTELIVIDRGKERSVQRNMGIVEATGQAFLILDSDQSVSPNLIQECVDLVECGYEAIYIPEIIMADSFFGKVRAVEREFYTGTEVDVPRFVTRKVCPLFNTELSGPEDAEWGQRIKGIRTISECVLYHNDDIGFIDYCKKKAYYTKSMKRYKELCPDDQCLNLKYRCFDVFVQDGKWKHLLAHPILTICVFFLLIVRGFIYAKR